MSEPGTQGQISIPDYKNWIVADARSNCTTLGVNLAIEGGTGNVEQSRIQNNAPGSAPGTPVGAGGIISVVIFPLKGGQG